MRRRKLATLLSVVVLTLGLHAAPGASAQVPDDPDIVDPGAGDADGGGADAADIPNRQIFNVRYNKCIEANDDTGTDAVLYRLPVRCGTTQVTTTLFEWTPTSVVVNGTRMHQLQYPAAAPDKCLSIENVESDVTRNGDDVQIEPCELGHDALWYFSASGLRNYNVLGPDRCLQADPGDGIGGRQVQIWSCNTAATEQDWFFSIP